MADKLIIRSNSRTLPNPLFTESFDSFSFKPSSSKFSRYSKPRSYGSYESSKPSTSPTIPKTKKCRKSTPHISSLIKKYTSEIAKMKRSLSKLETQREKADVNIERLTGEISAREEVVTGLREASGKLAKIHRKTQKKSKTKEDDVDADVVEDEIVIEPDEDVEEEVGEVEEEKEAEPPKSDEGGLMDTLQNTFSAGLNAVGLGKTEQKGGRKYVYRGGKRISRKLDKFLGGSAYYPSSKRGGRGYTATRRRYGY